MTPTEIAFLVEKLARGLDLDEEEARTALGTFGDQDLVTDPDASDGYFLLGFTIALMAKGPTPAELLGCAKSIDERTPRFKTELPSERVTDVAGTGGDTLGTFNVGSTTAFVLAACDMHVAKQSTRAYTSKSGSADYFQLLGVNPFDISPETVVSCLEDVGVAPFYTPQYAPAFRNRIAFLTKLKTLGLGYPTPWHLVAWIPSPFQLGSRVYGVMKEELVRPIASVFRGLGFDNVLVVHGTDGLDEVSNVGPTRVAEVRGQSIVEYTLQPADFGIDQSPVREILLEDVKSRPLLARAAPPAGKSFDALDSVRTSLQILYGEEKGPKASLVEVNAAASLYASGYVEDLPSGVEAARTAILSGSAALKLEALVRQAGDPRTFARLMRTLNVRH